MMNKSILIPKTHLSEAVGWSESTGRAWVNRFKDFIPSVNKGNKKFYNEESIRIFSLIKKLNESGLSGIEILEIFNTQGVPKNDVELKDIIKHYKEISLNYDERIAESIPSQKDLVIPILNYLKDGNAYTTSMLNQSIAEHFLLTEDQKNVTYPSNNRESIFLHRMRLARFSLKKQEYIDEVSKFTYQITNGGLELLNERIDEIEDEIEELEKVIDPFEVIQEKVDEIEGDLVHDLIDHLKQAHWRKLEIIVVQLLTAMGYGDGEVTGKTNDGGLDGIIKEDKLGLDNIYIQAKRWENTVGRPDVMSFSGALDAKGARKGIFITTSSFTNGAKEYADRLESKKIVLIDGKRLARLMIENNIGVNIKKYLVIKEVDFSYFEGE
ncbi:restriction endonuclease [Fictibacillus nanhaiensis]|uniref:restriction endonuclease n=1 Tax=Fictibacillus nanhaiensis TaxID=742169 RepID=UPI003C15A6A8